MEERDEPARKPSDRDRVERRRPYRRPALIEYGSVARLTQGTATVGNDGPGNTMRQMQCL